MSCKRFKIIISGVWGAVCRLEKLPSNFAQFGGSQFLPVRFVNVPSMVFPASACAVCKISLNLKCSPTRAVSAQNEFSNGTKTD